MYHKGQPATRYSPGEPGELLQCVEALLEMLKGSAQIFLRYIDLGEFPIANCQISLPFGVTRIFFNERFLDLDCFLKPPKRGHDVSAFAVCVPEFFDARREI